MKDMENISLVDGELIDYEYDQQQIDAENKKKLRISYLRLAVFFFIFPLAIAAIKLFIEVASFARRYS